MPAVDAGLQRGGVADDVDMEALKKKYSRPREELRAEMAANPSSGYQDTGLASAFDSQKLNDIKMCPQCQANGTVKRQYGYRVIEEQCESCGGEGVIRHGLSKPASEELREKVRLVEALIEQCEDLDELERLDAALKQRSLKALDAVLAKHRRAAPAPAAAAAEAADSKAAVDVSDGAAAPVLSAEELKEKDAEELKKKQADAAKKAKEKEALEAKNNERDAELAKQGKRAAGGMHKFDPDEVDVHGGKGTADDFMDAFGF